MDAAADVVRQTAACSAASGVMWAEAPAPLRCASSWALSMCAERRTLPCASAMRVPCVTLFRAVPLLGDFYRLPRMEGVASMSTIATVDVSSPDKSKNIYVYVRELGRVAVSRPSTSLICAAATAAATSAATAGTGTRVLVGDDGELAVAASATPPRVAQVVASARPPRLWPVAAKPAAARARRRSSAAALATSYPPALPRIFHSGLEER